MDCGGGAGGSGFCFFLLLGIELAGFFVVDVAFGFGDAVEMSAKVFAMEYFGKNVTYSFLFVNM